MIRWSTDEAASLNKSGPLRIHNPRVVAAEGRPKKVKLKNVPQRWFNVLTATMTIGMICIKLQKHKRSIEPKMDILEELKTREVSGYVQLFPW